MSNAADVGPKCSILAGVTFFFRLHFVKTLLAVGPSLELIGEEIMPQTTYYLGDDSRTEPHLDTRSRAVYPGLCPPSRQVGSVAQE